VKNGGAASAIGRPTNGITATIPIGQQPQALVYVPNAVPEGDGTANLTPLGEAGKASHLALVPPDGAAGAARATVSVNSLGALDLLQVAVSGLKPASDYTLWLTPARTPSFAEKEALVTFKTNIAGAQVAQTIGPLRKVLTERPTRDDAGNERFLLVTAAGAETPELIQSEPAAR